MGLWSLSSWAPGGPVGVVPVLLGPGQRSRTQWSQLVDNEAKWSVSSQG